MRLWLFVERRFAPLPLDREDPLLERALLLRARVEADVFEREEPPEEREEPPRDAPLADREDPATFVFAPERLEPELLDPELLDPELFGPELLDERLLPCPLREVDLLVAIRDTSSIENVVRFTWGTHSGT